MSKNAFEWLLLEPRLQIEEDRLREAFRDAGRSYHPDSGADPRDFEKLNWAMETLKSPAKRLEHWFACQGVVLDSRGVVDPAVMDLFGLVGESTQRATECARKRAAAQSALGLALLERETQQCIGHVEETVALVDQAIAREIGRFSEIERLGVSSPDLGSRTARNLRFLEKWRHTLRGLIPGLL